MANRTPHQAASIRTRRTRRVRQAGEVAVSYGLIIMLLGVAGMAGVARLGGAMGAAIGDTSSLSASVSSSSPASALVVSAEAGTTSAASSFTETVRETSQRAEQLPILGPGLRYVAGTGDGIWDALWDLGKGTLSAIKSVAWDFTVKDIAWGTASGLAGVGCKVFTLGSACRDSSWNPIKRTTDSVATFIKGIPNARHAIGEAAHQASLCLNPRNRQAAQDRGHACGQTIVAVGDIVLGVKGAGQALKGATALLRGARLADDVAAVSAVHAVTAVRPQLNASVLVPRSSGSFSVARVASILDDGWVRVEFPLENGGLGSKLLGAEELRPLAGGNDAALHIARLAAENDDLARYADQLRRAGDAPQAIEKFVASERDFYAFTREYVNPNAGYGERRLVVGGGRGPDTPHLRPNDVGIDAVIYGERSDLARLGEVRPDVAGSILDAPFGDRSFSELHFERVEPSAFLDHNARGLRESHRLLKPGGSITIQTGSSVLPQALENALRAVGFTDIKVGRLPDRRVVAAARAAAAR